MKHILYLTATVLLCSSCFHVNSNWSGGKNAIKGEGPVVTKSFDLKDFDQIVINGHADVTFAQSDMFAVSLSTQENIFDYLDFRVEGTTLILETKDNRSIRSEEFDVSLKAPALKSVTINGATDFDIKEGLVSDGDLSVVINGAGDLDFDNVRCRNLSIKMNGAGDLELDSVDVQVLNVSVNGAGDVKVSGNAVDADLSVNGAGNIDAQNLKVSGEAKKHASGVARVKY